MNQTVESDGGSAVFSCSVSGYPLAWFEWLFDGENVFKPGLSGGISVQVIQYCLVNKSIFFKLLVFLKLHAFRLLEIRNQTYAFAICGTYSCILVCVYYLKTNIYIAYFNVKL